MSHQVDDVDVAARKRALIALLVTIIVGAFAWVFVSRAADSGVERLATIDRVRAYCDSLIADASSTTDSARIAATPLRDTVDAASDKAIRTCGDLDRDRP